MKIDGKVLLQIVPALESGGVERGTIEVAAHAVKLGWHSVILSQGGRLVADLERKGISHIQMQVKQKSPFSFLSVFRLTNVLKALQRKGRVLLHARSRLPAWIAYLAQKRLDNPKQVCFVTTAHSLYSVNRYSEVMCFGERVICVSNAVKEYLLTSYPQIDHERLRVIYRGVDDAEFPRAFRASSDWLNKWYAEFPQLKNRRIILLPGRISRIKGHREFIQLIRNLHNENPSIHGVIVGEYDVRHARYFRELVAFANRLGLKDCITFTGHRADIREIFSTAQLVLNLTTKPESFGRTILEALSLGVPAAGYARGGTGEVLRAMYRQGLIDPRKDLTKQIIPLLEKATLPKPNCFLRSDWFQKEFALYQELLEK